MNILPKLGCVLALAAGMHAESPNAPANFQNESLDYSINWPSGLSLGEGKMEASRAGDSWDLRFTIEAALPGFPIKDRFRSKASAADLASIEFEKQFTHGKRKADEKTTFDQQKATAVRETVGGGKTEMQLPPAARDALAFVYFLRKELSQGRLPSTQTIFFGAPYQVHLEYGGHRNIQVSGNQTDADRLMATIKGPKSQNTVELFFARDPLRTPVLIRVPLSMGTFSMELVR